MKKRLILIVTLVGFVIFAAGNLWALTLSNANSDPINLSQKDLIVADLEIVTFVDSAFTAENLQTYFGLDQAPDIDGITVGANEFAWVYQINPSILNVNTGTSTDPVYTNDGSLKQFTLTLGTYPGTTDFVTYSEAGSIDTSDDVVTTGGQNTSGINALRAIWYFDPGIGGGQTSDLLYIISDIAPTDPDIGANGIFAWNPTYIQGIPGPGFVTGVEINDNALTIVTPDSSVPEPTTLLLLGFGLLAVGFSRKKLSR